MPITPAHVAFAWPLRHLGLSRLTLTIGSVVPDLAHLLPRRPWSDHTALSILTFDLPIGFAIVILMNRWVIPGLTYVWPTPWQIGVQQLWSERRSGINRVIPGLIFGSALHVLVDHFTHSYGVFVQSFPMFFEQTIAETPWGPIRTYQVLKHGLGVIGCLALIDAFLIWDRSTRTRALRWTDLQPWLFASTLILGVSMAWGYHESHWLPSPIREQDFLVQMVTAYMLLTVTTFFILSSYHQLQRWRTARKEPERLDSP